MADINKAKACIIAVHGNVLNKIGFNIAERANRSEELRLEKTLTTLTALEQKDVTRFKKEKYNLKSQLDRLQTSQMNRRKEIMKKSQSVGDNLSLLTVHKRLNQRRVTSGSIYEQKTSFDNADSHVRVRRSSGSPIISEHMRRNTISNQFHCSPEQPTQPDSVTNTEKPETQFTKAAPRKEARFIYQSTSDRVLTLRRQLSDPDLISVINTDHNVQMDVPERPSSASILPRLPRSPCLICPGDINQDQSTEDNLQCSYGTSNEDLHHQTQTAVKSQRVRLLPTMKAHFKASPDKSVAPCKFPKRDLHCRRRSVEPNMMRQQFQEQTSPGIDSSGKTNSHLKLTGRSNIDENLIDWHKITPRSYFLEYGVPLEKSQLLEILVEEREFLQERIRIFLFKNNP